MVKKIDECLTLLNVSNRQLQKAKKINEDIGLKIDLWCKPLIFQT